MQLKIYNLTFSKLQHFKIFLLSFGLISVVKTSNSFDYFKEKPSFLQACSLSQEDLTKCSTAAVQKLLNEVIKGVPEFKDVIGSLDPFVLNDLTFKQDNTEAANIQIGFSTLVIRDLSKLQVIESRVNRNDFSFLMKLHLPQLRLTGQYKLDGRILLLSLKARGEMSMELEDVNITALIKTHLFTRDDQTFYNVTEVKTDTNIGNLKTNFNNLFDGRSKDLEQSILITINENWREFFEVLRSNINEIIDQITFDLLHKICLFIPAKYFLDDIPTPEK
uniref:Uncharacterized protein n=1 Tax=Glossina brevipalpis TaxID=37001 RepID=A0A1A9W9I5_9MUSC